MNHHKWKVFLIEDYGLLRRCIVQALERDPTLIVCGQAEEAQEALAAIVSIEPDNVLTDIQFTSSSGLELIKTLRELIPALLIIAMTLFDVGRNERLARAAGATAFVSKYDGPEKLFASVHAVLRTARG